MPMLKHYRGVTEIGTLLPSSAVLKRALSGVFVLEFELSDVSDIYVGDSIQLEWNGETFTFIVREINERQVVAEHKSYVLRNYAVVDKYLNTPPTYDSLIEFADITLSEVVTFLSPLFADAGFSLSNNSVSSERKDISFNNDNLLSALQKTCETFKVEFVAHDGYIQIVDQYGTDTGLTVNAGIHTESIKKRIDRSNIVTRIYPIGSSENLPEGYYYTALRPTTFDLTTKTHTGNLYIDNTEAQQNYGIIEKVVEFSHIKVKSKRGTVSDVGSDAVQELGNKTYPYISDTNMNIPDPDKAKSATLFVKNELKAAELPIVYIDVENKRIYYNPVLKDGSTLSWTPAIGSEYILVGYISQAEMDAARDELIAEAQRYLEENADPKVSYEIANLYIPDGKVFDVGDSLHLKDDSAGIDTTVRVLEFAYDLVSKVYRVLKLSNSKEKLPYDIIREQAEQKRQIEQIKLQVSESWQTARDALERHNLLVRNNFYGSENEYLVIGSEARNYALKGLTITPDDGTAGKVSWTGFTFQHINETTEYTCGSGNQQLSVGTYYLYIQIKLSDPANASGMNKLVFSASPIENTSELNYYALGMAEFDGTRTKVATSYGFTLIDGNYIKTGTIEFDKLTNQLDLSGKVLSKANVIEIGDGIGPNASDTGIYIYDPLDSNAGYILTSSGLKYIKDKESAEILSILKQQKITFDGTKPEEIVVWTVPVPKEKLVIVKAIESVENLASNERVLVTAELVDDDGDSITNSAKIICEKIGGVWKTVSKSQYSTSLNFDLPNVSYVYSKITSTVYGHDTITGYFFGSATEERIHSYSGAASRTLSITVSNVTISGGTIKYLISIDWGDASSTSYWESHKESKWLGSWKGFWRLAAKLEYVDVSTKVPGKATINVLVLLKG